MASVEQRGPLAWRVVWRQGGRAGRKQSATFPTEAEAETARRLVEMRGGRITRAEVYAAVLGTLDEPETPPTVGEFARDWIIERRKLRDAQPDTIDRHWRIIMRHILPRLGALPITAVDRDMVRDWVAWMGVQPSRRGGLLDADTIRRCHSTLHSLLGAAVPRWLPANPAARLPGQRGSTGLPRSTPHEPLFLSAREADLILANCDEAIRPLVFTALRSGLRLGELLALRVEDLTLTGSRKSIRVARARKGDGSVGPPKTRRSRRTVSISKEVSEVLAPLVEGRRRTDLVFPAPGGGMWNPSNLTNRYWIRAVAAAMRCPAHPPPEPPKPRRGPRRKLWPDEVSTCDCPTRLHRRPRFHDLRHTHVSLCIEAGWRETRVSRRVGHESIQTTINIYGHLWDTDSDERLDAVERLLLVADDEAA